MKLQNEDKVTVEFTKEQIIETLSILHAFAPEELFSTGILGDLEKAADLYENKIWWKE